MDGEFHLLYLSCGPIWRVAAFLRSFYQHCVCCRTCLPAEALSRRLFWSCGRYCSASYYIIQLFIFSWLFSPLSSSVSCCPCHWWHLFTIKSPAPWNPCLSPWVHISPKTLDVLWGEQLGPSYSGFLSKDIALKSYLLIFFLISWYALEVLYSI